MSRSGKSHRDEYLILIVLGLVVIGTTALLTMDRWRDGAASKRPYPSTYSNTPEGMRVYHTLLDRLSLKAKRNESPLFHEELAEVDVLFLLNPVSRVDRMEREELDEWLRAGGVLVTSDPSSVDLARTVVMQSEERPQPFPRRSPPRDLADVTAVAENEPDLPLARDVSSIATVSPATLDIQPQDPPRTSGQVERLFADERGLRVAAAPVGRGWVIALADSSFLNNGWIGLADNAVLAVNLAAYARNLARGPNVSFDEYHNGFGRRLSGWSIMWAMLLETAAGWAVLSLTAAGILYLFYRGRRFGSRYPLERRRRRSKLEYIQSVATTYQAAGANRLTFGHLYQRLRRRLAAAVGLPPSADSGDVAAALARRMEQPAQRYDAVLRQCDAVMAQRRLSNGQLRQLTAELAAIELEVLHGNQAGQ